MIDSRSVSSLWYGYSRAPCIPGRIPGTPGSREAGEGLAVALSWAQFLELSITPEGGWVGQRSAKDRGPADHFSTCRASLKSGLPVRVDRSIRMPGEGRVRIQAFPKTCTHLPKKRVRRL